MTTFVSLDVEIANPDMASICQIGFVQFEDGVEVDSWSSLVDPKDEFDFLNMSIHGIGPDDVIGAPVFSDVAPFLGSRLQGQVVAIHTAFDRNAILQASSRSHQPLPDCHWLNTASVARRTWPEVARKGYGLAPLAKKLGIQFKHHDALEDARAAGLVLLHAMRVVPLDLSAWLVRVTKPIDLTSVNGAVTRKGKEDGPLSGELIVFTGSLAIARREAAAAAADAGCDVADGVTKHTTLLVCGDQDYRVLGGHEKSAKHRKAEELAAKGYPIRIITESDFFSMIDTD